jgi:hypothetical protein
MLADSSVADNNAVLDIANSRHGRISMGAQGISNAQDRVRTRKTQVFSGEPDQHVDASSKQGREAPAPKPTSHVPQARAPDPDVLARPSVGSSIEAESSEHLNSNNVGMQMAATEQWRDGVMGQEFAQDDEDVRAISFITTKL